MTPPAAKQITPRRFYTDLTVAEAARRVGVSPAPLYRHLPAACATMAEKTP